MQRAALAAGAAIAARDHEKIRTREATSDSRVTLAAGAAIAAPRRQPLLMWRLYQAFMAKTSVHGQLQQGDREAAL